MPWLAAAGMIAAPIIGGALGNAASAGAQTNAEDAAKQAAQAYNGISAPSVADMQVALQKYQNTGNYDPNMEQATNLGQTAMQDISTDPRLRQAQMSALQSISQKAQTGLSQADLASFDLATRNAGAQNQAQQAQIMQNMAARGQGGSGNELIARLQANQNATNSLQNAQLQQAQAAEQARTAALTQMANQSTQMRNQDYSQASDLAKAKDVISQYNAANSQNVNNTNVAAKNQGQLYNVQNAQNLGNANTNIANQQETTNKGVVQQQFNDQLSLAGGKSGADKALSNYWNGEAGQQQAAYSQAGNGIATGIAGASKLAGSK